MHPLRLNRWAGLVALASSLFAQAPAPRPKVIVISLDGLPASALNDPRLPVPTLRKLIANGTFAPLTPVNPTVTWPNHTSMVTGVAAEEHGLLANGTITPTGAWPPMKVEPWVPKERMVHVPTVYDAVFKAGLTTAQIDWVAIHQAQTITWAFSEWATADGPLEKEMIERGFLTTAEVTDFSKANILYRDQVWTRAAEYLIKYHQPDLLLYHLLSLDSTHHEYGPDTHGGRVAMAFLDACVARVVNAVRDAGLMERTTFLVVSDHGFKAFTKEIRANIALDAAGLKGKVWVLPEGGTAYVYMNPREAAELAPRARKALEGVEGIERVMAPEEYAALGLPTPEKDPQFGQLLLAAKTGYSFSGATGGPVTAAVPQQRGSHGYLASDPDMAAIFIASGRGVTAGTKLGSVANSGIAPTIAELLGVSLPTAKGKPIRLR
jgi:predicted AlkP superfamily pyrophosphatase or phosphodiesterase